MICLCFISIPYGAIKSPIAVKIEAIKKIFQFLMVRLKETNKNLKELGFKNFNSLWCD